MSPLTAQHVGAMTFDKTPIGNRGYHEDQVDELLDTLATTIAGLDARS